MVDSTFNVLSLCSGAGGLDLGLRLALCNARTVGYVEREAYACEILASRMEDETLDEAPLWTDLRTFDGKPWRGSVDCVIGGYPCQPFSVAGLRRGVDDPRHLWPHIARIIREIEPAWCFFENVANHLNIGYREVRGELEDMGFRVAEGLFTAAEVGASHKRERLFILAHLCGAGLEKRQPGGGKGERQAVRGHPAGPTDVHCTLAHAGIRGAGQSGDEPGTVLRDDAGLDPRFRGVRVQQSLADSRGERLEGDGAAGAAVGRSSGAVVPRLFPPGPDDIATWKTILDHAPSLEPAVCGMADGVADRVDRLRLCGNGVVPLAAAYAFLTLHADLERRSG